MIYHGEGITFSIYFLPYNIQRFVLSGWRCST